MTRLGVRLGGPAHVLGQRPTHISPPILAAPDVAFVAQVGLDQLPFAYQMARRELLCSVKTHKRTTKGGRVREDADPAVPLLAADRPAGSPRPTGGVGALLGLLWLGG